MQICGPTATPGRDRPARYQGQRGPALRVYTTRLLGGEPRLVLLGGGHTSVKTKVADITCAPVDVLCVKAAAGHGTIEAPGCGVASRPVARAVGLQALSDEDMVNVPALQPFGQQVAQSFGRDAVHAFRRTSFIDPPIPTPCWRDRPARRRGAGGRRLTPCAPPLVPYVMPGFALAKKTNEVSRANPDVEGLTC